MADKWIAPSTGSCAEYCWACAKTIGPEPLGSNAEMQVYCRLIKGNRRWWQRKPTGDCVLWQREQAFNVIATGLEHSAGPQENVERKLTGRF